MADVVRPPAQRQIAERQGAGAFQHRFPAEVLLFEPAESRPRSPSRLKQGPLCRLQGTLQVGALGRQPLAVEVRQLRPLLSQGSPHSLQIAELVDVAQVPDVLEQAERAAAFTSLAQLLRR